MKVKGPMMIMFLMCYIFSLMISHEISFAEAKSLSTFNDVEIEKRLNAINKPAIKIIKTIDGKHYGCVDFFKQPAFDRPSMKNHKYHFNMRPRGEKEGKNTYGYLWENGVGCPIGTVPMPRVTKDDLLSLLSLGEDSNPRGSWNYGDHHFAVGRTKDIGMSYNGATMSLSVNNPKVQTNQFSASRLHIQIGEDYIQTGLIVNPALYGDNETRTFVYTKAGGSSCYNSLCDVGMVSTRPDYPIGLVMEPKSIRGANLTSLAIFGIVKDKADGNWWLQLNENAERIGFWPSSRFQQSSGNLVEWGGEVYSASLPSPQMGFGYFPVLDMSYDAYIKFISTVDGNDGIDLRVEHLEEFADDIKGYKVKADLGKVYDESVAGHIIFYGGPGNL